MTRKRKLYESPDSELRELADRAAPPLKITVRDGQVVYHEETGDRVVPVVPEPETDPLE